MLVPSIKRAFKASSPALVGYITLGMAFGFLIQKAGAAWFGSTGINVLTTNQNML